MEKLNPELARCVAIARFRCALIIEDIEKLKQRVQDNLAYLETIKERLEAERQGHEAVS